jgi:hypothetical protein
VNRPRSPTSAIRAVCAGYRRETMSSPGNSPPKRNMLR